MLVSFECAVLDELAVEVLVPVIQIKICFERWDRWHWDFLRACCGDEWCDVCIVSAFASFLNSHLKWGCGNTLRRLTVLIYSFDHGLSYRERLPRLLLLGFLLK